MATLTSPKRRLTRSARQRAAKKLSAYKVTDIKLALLRGWGRGKIHHHYRVSKVTIAAIQAGVFWCGRRDSPGYEPTNSEMQEFKRRYKSLHAEPKKMQQRDICNVGPVNVDELLDVLKMISVAGENEMNILESAERWTVVE